MEGLQSAIDRACAYVEAGADMVFPEAVAELHMYKAFAAATKTPISANITEFGATPLYTVEELARVDVSLILYPLSAFRAMSAAALNVYRTIRSEGSQKNVVADMQTRGELYDFLDYHWYEEKLNTLFQDPREKPKMSKAVEGNLAGPRSRSVLSGVVAGNTAICSVGRTGNDLHYRGYDILDIADIANSKRLPICWCIKNCPP